MICEKCGDVMPKLIVGNVIDYRHPGILSECPPQPSRLIAVVDSFEPAARHYRNIEVSR